MIHCDLCEHEDYKDCNVSCDCCCIYPEVTDFLTPYPDTAESGEAYNYETK